MTIAFDFQYGMEIGDAPDDVPREVLDREERGDVERHGQESRGEGRTSQAVEVRVLRGGVAVVAALVAVVLVDPVEVGIDEGIVGQEEERPTLLRFRRGGEAAHDAMRCMGMDETNCVGRGLWFVLTMHGIIIFCSLFS